MSAPSRAWQQAGDGGSFGPMRDTYLPQFNPIAILSPHSNGVGVPNMPSVSVSAEMPPSTNIANTELPLTPIVTLN